MIGDSIWTWALEQIFGDFVKTVDLHPFKFVGEPAVTVERVTNKRSLRVVIYFDVEPM